MEKTQFFLMGVKICIKNGDILEEKVDAIVNPASPDLSMGGGLSKKIKKNGGDIIEKEAIKKGFLNTGESIFTGAGKFPSKYIIHTITVDKNFRTNYKIIANCMKNTFKIANSLKLKSISFPALGCGTGKLESKKVAEIMIKETLNYLSEKFEIEDINFVIYKKKDYLNFCDVYEKYLRNLTKKTYKNPIPTVDIIIEHKDGIVLIERRNYPKGWAIPGGFVEYGESCEETAIREAKEETGLELEDLKQFKTYSKPGRDPRFHTISTVFIAKGKGELKSGDDAKNAKIFNEENIPENIAFDHRDILKEYFLFKNKLRS
jgi:ADP-ribose pyrophosphatase YjhB (NUDIX family)/O-acetyl-ADP-ribose deacetylase (regulator of RNase III)